MQAKAFQAETLVMREAAVKESKAAIVRNNSGHDINAHIKEMYNWRALEMALNATGKAA